MARSRHCRACDGWHSLEAWPAACADHFGTRGPRSDLPIPSIRTDGIDPIQSMADGHTYDSRSAYYRSVKSAGCEIVGDEKGPFDKGPREYVPEGVGEDIKRAIAELRG